jgi:hypothetical protein
MKPGQVCLILVFLLFAVSARADSISDDGRIIIGHGSDPSPADSCGSNGRLDFKIHLNGSGGGIKNCINTSGVTWVGLKIFAVIPLGDTVKCDTTSSNSDAVFSQCSWFILSTFGHKENIEIILSGGEIAPGFPGTLCTAIPAPPSCFFINLNTSGSSNPNSAGGWSALEGGNIDAEAIPAPEPSTILLILSGVGIISRRRLR